MPSLNFKSRGEVTTFAFIARNIVMRTLA